MSYDDRSSGIDVINMTTIPWLVLVFLGTGAFIVVLFWALNRLFPLESHEREQRGPERNSRCVVCKAPANGRGDLHKLGERANVCGPRHGVNYQAFEGTRAGR